MKQLLCTQFSQNGICIEAVRFFQKLFLGHLCAEKLHITVANVFRWNKFKRRSKFSWTAEFEQGTQQNVFYFEDNEDQSCRYTKNYVRILQRSKRLRLLYFETAYFPFLYTMFDSF